jgi:hypothetical protein
MPTALQLGSRAARLIGALASGQTMPPAEAADMLEALNAMMDAWRIERLMVYQVKQGSHSWASGNASRTIGTGGNFDTTRPDRIESAFLRDSNSLDHPLTVLTEREQYDAITQKSDASTLPDWLFYDPAYPLGTLYLHPKPSANLTLLLNSWQILQSFDDTAESLALPPGYENAIVFNLACDLGPEYDITVPPWVVKRAAQYKAAVKTNNAPSMVARLDSGIAFAGRIAGRAAGNILVDG